MNDVGNTIHCEFNGDRDLLFNFLGGVARPLGDDLNPSVGNIRIGFNREISECHGAADDQGNAQAENQNPVSQGKANDFSNQEPAPSPP